MQRRIVETDLEGLLANDSLKLPKEHIVEIAALNVIRAIIDDDHLFSFNDYNQEYQGQNGLTVLLNATVKFMKKESDTSNTSKLKDFFENILLTTETDLKASDVASLEECGLLTQNEINDIKSQKQLHCTSIPMDNISLSTLATMTDWNLSESKGKC